MECDPCSMTLALPLQSKNEARAKYGNINNVLRDKASNSGTGKQKRMSMNQRAWRRLNMTGWSKPTEASS